MRRAWLCSLLLLLRAAGGQEIPAPPPIMRITVTLVQVDAVVTDGKGRRVPNLSPQDFEILQDGRPQKITHFVYVPEPPPGPARIEQAPGAPPPIARSQVRRTVALVVDDNNLSFENLVRAREGLREYVERQIQPGDLAAVVRTGGGVAMLEQFTNDKRILLEAIDLMKWRFPGRLGGMPLKPLPAGLEREADRPAGGPEILDDIYSLPVLGSIGTLTEVIRGMKNLPGRKSVVFFSDDLTMESQITPALDRLTDLANRSAVTVYTVNPAGLRAPGWTSAENSGAGLGASLREMEFIQQAGLDYLASRTGGLSFSHNDIPGAIREAADDQLGYYLLGYSPEEGTFDEDPRKAKFHRVAVRLKRPGLRVRWKSGFTGVADGLPGTDEDPESKPRRQQVMEAFLSPFAATGLKVRLTSLVFSAKEGPGVRTMLVFNGKDLAFKREPDGDWHAMVEILCVAYRGLKQSIQWNQGLQDIRLPDELYQRSLKEGFLYEFAHAMKEPGPFLIRAVVRDVASGRVGSASQYVRVPDTRKGRLGVSGIVVKLAPPELVPPEFAAAAVKPKDGKAEAWTEGGPALRRYQPGQVVAYGYVVMNPKLKGGEKAPDAFSQTRVFRNGTLIYTGAPVPLEMKSAVDEGRFVCGGALRLGQKLTPGEYILQVTVTDRLAKKKEAQVSEWIDFEVVGPKS